MNKYETLIPGFSATGPTGYSVQIETADDNKFIKFDAGEAMTYCLTNPLKATSDMTVGDINRLRLHKKLDEWIDANLKGLHGTNSRSGNKS
jgi:hypothetical protein